jgi:hypothetical protein
MSRALVVALIVGLGAVALVLQRYGGASFFPGLIASFIATLFAFVLALWWERRREQHALIRDTEELDRRQKTEVRRRFAPVRLELEKNADSLALLTGKLDPDRMQTTFAILHPQLLEGACVANAPRLSQLVADYDLIGDLAMTYGRIEELRWRLRYRSELHTNAIDGITVPLVEELREEVAGLLQRVGAQIDAPDVQPVGLLSKVGLSAGITPTGSLTRTVIRAGGSARSSTADSAADPPFTDS